MKLSNGEKLTYSIFILVLIMVNPPILNKVNSYAIENPLTLGWPTLFLWLEFWYVIGIITFYIAAVKIKSWKKVVTSDDILNTEKERAKK